MRRGCEFNRYGTFLANDVTISGKMLSVNWQRLGDVVRERRTQLGLTQVDVDKRGGPSVQTLRTIENNHSGRLCQRLRRALERALEWEPGSIDDILRGGAPTELRRHHANSASLGGAVDDQLVLAACISTMTMQLRKHRNHIQQSAYRTLSQELSRSAREAARVIASLMPLLTDRQRDKAITILAHLRAQTADDSEHR